VIRLSSTGRDLVLGTFVVLLAGCVLTTISSDDVPFAFFQPAVPRLRQAVQGELTRHLAAQQAATLKELANASVEPAVFKQPLVLQSLTDPWAGIATLEQQGQGIANLARAGSQALPALIAALETGMDRAPAAPLTVHFPSEREPEEFLTTLIVTERAAHRLREQALRRLSPEERQFLFDHAASLVQRFTPQVSEIGDETMAQLDADRRFLRLIGEQVDYHSLAAAALVVAQLADEAWLQQLKEAFQGRPAVAVNPVGVTGTVLLMKETSDGLIVIGGPGPNRYELDQKIAVVIDLGGDDTYRGAIAAATDVRQGVSVVVDLDGNDVYQPSPLGLATGRAGVGLLIDRTGDDVYDLAPGSGGTGFAGLGILLDLTGDDQYKGTKFTQGAAVGGLGLLLDQAGSDTYTSFGYAVGFGGPLGVGAVIDAAGNDRYQCGGRDPSSYNAVEGPDRQPDDPLFQYDCFGLGAGVGTRIFTRDPEQRAKSLAGGWGLLIDLAGDDRYRGSNFSQGAGYFFGAGLKLDLAGNDEHVAARYGLAAGAHWATGLFVDYGGNDRYTSTGPFYNGGAAWDHSVMVGIDAGPGDDQYDLQGSDGLGLADRQAWSLFLEEGGRDRYRVPRGMGTALNASLSGFFDLFGEDEYALVPPSGLGRRGNRQTLVDSAGALFQDR